jgi:hypothetical protein
MAGAWLLEEGSELSDRTLRALDRSLAEERLADLTGGTRGRAGPRRLGVRLQDIVIGDNRKWFGEANIRIDALVVTGHGDKDHPASFYMPGTFRFGRVADGDRLPTGEGGLLLFEGLARHFIDIFITVSRDRKDSDDLASALAKNLGGQEVQTALGTIMSLVASAPTVAAVTGAIAAAGVIGDAAYRILRVITGNTIGLFHAGWLQFPDRFGIGRHPAGQGSYEAKDLSFWYEIVRNEPSG